MFFKKKKVHGEHLFKCPRCKLKMEKLKKKNVVIDVCKKCKGMWLDDGEIHKLLNIAKKAQKVKKSKKGT
jgi:hypothetical protein